MDSKNIFSILGRLAAAVSAIFLALVGLLRFDDGTYYSFYHILAAIYIMMAFAIVLSVIPLAVMKRYYAFTSNHLGLGLFMIFAGFLVYEWHKKEEFACAITLFSTGLYNALIGLIL